MSLILQRGFMFHRRVFGIKIPFLHLFLRSIEGVLVLIKKKGMKFLLSKSGCFGGIGPVVAEEPKSRRASRH